MYEITDLIVLFGGCGGIFKSIVRIAVPIAVSFAPWASPLIVAASSAIATAATGGSFTETLMAGATSYVGSSLGEAITGGLQGTTLASSAPVGIGSAVHPLAGGTALGTVAGAGGAVAGAGGAALGTLASAGNALTKTLSSILSPSAFATLVNNAGLAGKVVGGLTTLTLNQALNQDVPGLDDALASSGFDAEQIENLHADARNEQIEAVFQNLVNPENVDTVVANPFLKTSVNEAGEDIFTGTEEEQLAANNEFQRVIAQGLQRGNRGLGEEVTQEQFDTFFNNPNLGQNILGEETGIRQGGFNEAINQAFPGDAFSTIDDEIINNIVSERQGPAQQQISNFEARGNLNPTGGLTANEFLSGQVQPARARVSEIGQGVLSTNQSAIDDIRDRARQQVGGFQLGDDLFDVAPFTEERSNLIGERTGALGSDLRTAIGSQPLFDVSGALQAGGRTQGVVSGTPNQSFLDAIAARESGTKRTSRGLGSRGSGAF
jgi:hypothetical protein